MNLEEITDIYLLISKETESSSANKASIGSRRQIFANLLGDGIIKNAFDTRRVNQETDYIARRGLKNYSRSEQFIAQGNIEKLQGFQKLRSVLKEIHSQYGRQPGWQDSYCRVLLGTVERALRTEQKDGEVTDSQPGVGSIDYLEEMISVRYRLAADTIASMEDENLKTILLAKDPELTNPDVAMFMPPKPGIEISPIAEPHYASPITRADVNTQSYDALVNKLFEGVKASRENPQVERTVTITIKDKLGA